MPDTLDRVVKTTCPRDCYDSCGVLIDVRDGAVRRVRADASHGRTHGALCGKCALAYNGAWIDPRKRLSAPLRRSGRKGAGAFEAVSWDEAMAGIAARLQSVVARRGGPSILQTHYTGTCSLIAGNFPLRFFNRIGATEVDPDTVCNKAGHEVLQLMYGSSTFGFDPRTSADARCLVVWGANPSACGPHIHKYWLQELRGHAKLIVVDPIRHDTAASADLHLAVRPGADALLAFSMLHAMRRQGLLDESFLAAHAEGWDAVRAQVDAADPALTAKRTGVDAALVEEAARWYGRGPSLLWMGQGLQRQASGGNVFRSVALLPAAAGQVGRAGTGLLYLNGAAHRGLDVDRLCGSALRSVPAPAVSHMDLAAALEDPARSAALFTWNNNIAASSPEQSRLRRALEREDLLHVAVELFETDTTRFADYVLPAASFMEFDDVVLPYFDYAVSAQVGAAAAPGQSLPNQEIFRRLARAMGYTEEPLFESDAALIEGFIAELGIGIAWSELARRGTVPWREQPVIPFAGPAFPTPGGRIDIASERWVAAGLSYAPRAEADAAPAQGRLRLLSPADGWLMNSSYGNDAEIARQLGAQSVRIHPAEAGRRGLQAGQAVRLRNGAGELEVTLDTSDAVPEGVALLPKGRWPMREAQGANVNVLHGGVRTDVGASNAVHSIEVEMIAL